MSERDDRVGPATSAVVVVATLVASLFGLLVCAGLLRQGGASPTLTHAILVFVGVSMAIGQPPAAAELARRMGGALSEGTVVSVALRISSLLLLSLTVLASILL